ncbi:MAG: tetratricopeptide repeat protein [Trueperaceae bacterium]
MLADLMCSEDTKLLSEAQVHVNKRYPGIRLESPVQGWAYLNEFQRGISVYNSLEVPRAADDRWLGVCFFQIFEDMRAQEAFFRALAKGEEAARVNLAHLLRFLERSEEAVSELLRVDVQKLSGYDLVLYFRVSSLHEETNGNIRMAVEYAEKAWRNVQGIPEYQILAPSVLGQLGILYGRMGEARKALWYFDQGIRLTTGLEQHKVRLRRATLLINLGRGDEVEAELHSLGDLPEALNLEREYLFGELLWSKGQLDRALQSFSAIVDTASRLAVGSDEFASRLSLAAILTHSGNYAEAHDHLEKARILISDRTDVLLHRFREILVNVRGQHYGWEEAASELEMLAIEFRSIGTLQEEACVRLHLADIYRQLSDKRTFSQVSTIRDICRTVHNSQFLKREWLLLPELESTLRTLEPELFENPRSKLVVVTVGREELILDGRLATPPMRRTVEILAYFLEVKEVPLARIMADLFPAQKARTARSYFHQCRHHLRKQVPGVEIVFNRERNHYELNCDIEVLWDVSAIRRGEVLTVAGPFLPSSSAAWAGQVNRELLLLGDPQSTLT